MSILKKNIFLILIFLAINLVAQNEIQNITIKDGLPSNIVYDIKQDKIGYLWIATEKGLVKFDGDDFIQIHKLKTTNLFIGKNDVIYSGLENGLFIKNKSSEKTYSSKKVLKTLVHENDVFVGTIEGIYSLKNNNLTPVKINSTIDFSIINDIIYINNSYFLSSSKGLIKVDNILNFNNINLFNKEKTNSIEIFQNTVIAATAKNKLLIIKQDSISDIIETISNISSVKKLKNELWVTSKTNGIEVFSLPSFSFKQKINKYNSLETNQINSVFKDEKGAKYIASNKGVYVIQNNLTTTTTTHRPLIHFENLQINHKNQESLFVVNNLKLSNSENNIAISFKTIDLSNPKKIQYRYQLNGKLSSWSTNNTVNFPNLNAGKYNFKVQSKINTLESDFKSFSFTIDAPFYKQAWFVFAVIITFLVTSYTLLHFYIKNINKKNKEKVDQLKLKNRLLTLEQKALQLQMNPHFIFNVLNGIKALGNASKIDELNNNISKFSVLLRGILNNSRKEEITLQEEIDLLKNYIELEQRMSSKSFSYSINTHLNNIDSEEILIPTMLIQPFVENSIEHAFQKNKQGEIIINFEVKHHFLLCRIMDNGIGINQSKKQKQHSHHKSVALKVSKERLYIISTKSNLKITEIKENKEIKGTEVNFRIPLKTDY
ncbi:histidine kinase [Polaribacter sp. Asnod6-C07]|uniref:histidine kinase n=1 Tax=Polaribacter sp. Asnod6-C07 TaxID=3160582 RepID=UPI003869B96C